MKILLFIFNMTMFFAFGFWIFIAALGVSGTNAEITGAYIAVNSFAVVGWFYFIAKIIKSLR